MTPPKLQTTRFELLLGQGVSAMVGNSSSGLLEAPSFTLPVVNIGNRQKGRLRAGNVIDVPLLSLPVHLASFHLQALSVCGSSV